MLYWQILRCLYKRPTHSAVVSTKKTEVRYIEPKSTVNGPVRL